MHLFTYLTKRGKNATILPSLIRTDLTVLQKLKGKYTP